MEKTTSQLLFKTKLSRIEEVINWNKELQLKCQDNKEDILSSNSKQNNPTNALNVQPHSIQNKQVMLQQSFDEVPIKVSNSKYNDCLDNVALSNKTTQEYQGSSVKPKFRFLKRGEGIARFRMRPIKIKKTSQSVTPTKLSLNLEKPPDVNKPKTFQTTRNTIEIPKLEPPDVKLDFKDWKKIFSEGKGNEFIEQAIENSQLEVFNPDMSIDSSTASVIERMISVGRRHLKERKELTVFEAMEQHVLDSSFNSSSSYVTRMMEQAVISTPIKKSSSTNKSEEPTSETEARKFVIGMLENYINEPNNSNDEHFTKPLSPIKNLEREAEVEAPSPSLKDKSNPNESVHVRFADQVDYKSFVEYSKSFNSPGEECVSKESIEEQEEWKEGDCDDSYSCSECGSTGYSSSDDDVRPITPPELNPVSNASNTPETFLTQNENGSTEKLLLKDLESPGIELNQNQQKNKENEEIGVLKHQLENEIKSFRAENQKLKLLRERLEKERKLFINEKKKLLKELEEEKVRNKAYIEEEKQKLSKEKLVFEKYCKSTKNPTREERKEIQSLRDQLNEMKEELNKKESRWGAAQARVRIQVKSLEEDNNKLKEEVEVLRKKAKHLEFLTCNKKGLSNTKMIHAINEYLTAAQFEADNPFKLVADKGFFEHKTDPVIKPVVVLNTDTANTQSVRVIKEGMSAKNNMNVLEHTYQQSVLGKNTKECSRNVPLSMKTFSKPVSPMKETPINPPVESSKTNNNEVIYNEGNKEVKYKNGTVKQIDPVTGNEKIFYLNGDVKEKKRDGTVKYYFSESRIWQTSLPDGLEISEHPSGQVQKRFTDGTVETTYPNDCRKITYPDKSEKIFYSDGTKVEIKADGKSKILYLPNGQKEVHTEECIRREYPDGTTKTVYPDGVTQTVYSNGRVRLKDKDGNLIKDSCP